MRGGGNGIANGNGHTITVGDAAGASEADASLSEVAGPGGDKLEGTDATEDDAVHLKRRVGLFSGVALIVGTMIGEYCFVLQWGALIVGTMTDEYRFVLQRGGSNRWHHDR